MNEARTEFVPRPGALRCWDGEANCWRYANPGDPLFSTMSMVATEFWSPGVGWKAIFDDQG